MARQKIAVFGGDKLYQERFVNYFMEHRGKELELSVFTEGDGLKRALEEEPYQLLVLDESQESLLAGEGQRTVPVMVLSGEETGGMDGKTDGQVPAAGDRGKISHVMRYQSMDALYAEMKKLMALRGEGDAAAMCACGRMTGVISPSNHELQMLFSLMYADCFAADQKVLYLNLRENSGFSRAFGKSGGRDIGDFIKRLREREATGENFLEYVEQMEGFDYVNPIENPENFHAFTEDDFLNLFRLVKGSSHYDVAVVDFGSCLQMKLPLLAECSSLYCIKKNGYLSECQEEEFMHYLRVRGGEELCERICGIELPFQGKCIHGGNYLMEQAKWSEFGDYMRSLFQGGRYAGNG